jgi:pimeloyl-ACP methyl ester carboxylesterase
MAGSTLVAARGAGGPNMQGFVRKGAVAIHYRVLGQGEPLVLLHGFTDSSESWIELGYAGPLQAAGRRLVLIDLRGHGASGRPHDPAAHADMERALDVVHVLDALGIAQADMLGYSMGGWIALCVARYFPERLGRLAVGGAHPFGQSMEGYRRAVAGGLGPWLDLLERQGGGLPGPLRARIAACDPKAMRAAVAHDRPDIATDLIGLDRPALFYAGEADPLLPAVLRVQGTLPRARAVALPACNHLTAFLAAERALPHLLRFLGLRAGAQPSPVCRKPFGGTGGGFASTDAP